MTEAAKGLLSVPLYKWMIFIAALLFTGAVWRFYYVRDFLDNAVLTKGIVTSVTEEMEYVQRDNGHYDQEITFGITVGYKDRNGILFSSATNRSSNPLGDEGDSVALYYDPADPDHVMFETDIKVSKGMWVLFGLSGFFLLNSFFWYKRYKYVQRQNNN